jgi:hypothetical protein
MSDADVPDPAILCPFLRMAAPDTSSFFGFVRGCSDAGMGWSTALFVTLQVTSAQKGLGAALRGQTPDLHQLDKVPGVSHPDLYGLKLEDLRSKADERAVEGRITLQDLVELKEWLAQTMGVAINEASQIETALVFIRAGGDFETARVALDDVFLLLEGRAPRNGGEVNLRTILKARRMSRWQSPPVAVPAPGLV